MLASLAEATLAPRLHGVAVAQAALLRHCTMIAHNAASLPELVDGLLGGSLAVALPIVSGEAIGQADGPRGTVWHWLRLEGGQIGAAFLCDPGWASWAECVDALRGVAAEDAGLVLAALGCSAAGVDL